MKADREILHRLDIDNIIQASRDATGLSDMGEPDILPAIRVLIEALRKEAHLNSQGVETQRAALIGLLENRMRIADLFRRHPEILDEEIRGPVIITGLARSGTTKLQRMIAADPEMQKLPMWRLMHPLPLGPMVAGEEDPRIALTEQQSAMMREYFPNFFAGHPMLAREADEETFLADLAMRSSFNCHAVRVPSFDRWLEQQDYSSWYVYLRKLLQLFQWQDGSPQKTWLLKAPGHLGHIRDLFTVFPKATLVHCHRDPVTTTASMAQLSEASRRMYSDLEQPLDVGQLVLRWWSGLMQSYVEQRPALERPGRFVDVPYAEITRDAMAAIERVYEAAGLSLSVESREAMIRWEAGNPPGKHGQHAYSLQRFKLTDVDVRAAFADYLTRFGALI